MSCYSNKKKNTEENERKKINEYYNVTYILLNKQKLTLNNKYWRKTDYKLILGKQTHTQRETKLSKFI